MKRYRFGEFALDVDARQLRARDGSPVALTPKALDALAYMVEHPGRALAKGELMDALWPEAVVEEANLSQTVYTLRRALGDGAGSHRYIATLPGRGYQFIARVEHDADAGMQAHHPAAAMPLEPSLDPAAGSVQGFPAGQSRSGRAPTSRVLLFPLLFLAAAALAIGLLRDPAPPVHSLAVLPFRPLLPASADPALEAGIAEGLAEGIGSISGLTVSPPALVRRHARTPGNPVEVARSLGVDAVLEGHVHRAGERVRVSARLLSGRDGSSLWAGSYDEPFTQVPRVQARIIEAVRAELVPHSMGPPIAPGPPQTASADAYALYLKGRYFWNRRNPEATQKAISFFQQALALDPDYALAHAGIADCYRSLPIRSDVEPRPAFALARASAMRALEIEPGLAQAHTALGWIALFHQQDWASATSSFQRALQLDPGNVQAHIGLGHVYSVTGRHAEALREIERALAADPVSLHGGAMKGLFLLSAGRADDALRQLQSTIELDPNAWVAHNVLGNAYLRKGMHAKASAAFAAARLHSQGGAAPRALEALAAARAGDVAQAQAVLAQLQAERDSGYVSPYHIALLHHALGHPSRALDWLETGLEERDVHMVFLGVDSRWDALAGNPRFLALLRQMNLQRSGGVGQS